MEYVVSDQNGGQGFVKSVTDPKNFFGPLVALVSHGTHTNLADGGIGGLTAGAVGRAKKEE